MVGALGSSRQAHAVTLGCCFSPLLGSFKAMWLTTPLAMYYRVHVLCCNNQQRGLVAGMCPCPAAVLVCHSAA